MTRGRRRNAKNLLVTACIKAAGLALPQLLRKLLVIAGKRMTNAIMSKLAKTALPMRTTQQGSFRQVIHLQCRLNS